MNFFKKMNWILSAQFGIDIRKLLLSIWGIPRYIYDLIIYRSTYSGPLGLMPCFSDRYEEGGATKNEYFWQDLYVANKVFQNSPYRHVDIGSRIDGFVAHVASFREIEIFDIRNVSTKIPGITFKQADLMRPQPSLSNYCDSISCLHALEHFGLGRYGDDLDPDGWRRGLINISLILKNNGILYLSVPVGRPRVEFNAHRVFNPIEVIALSEAMGFTLCQFAFWDTERHSLDELGARADFIAIAHKDYGLGIFTFKKN